MMKLFAFRDRSADADKDLGRYHALDLYSVLAMTSEPEWLEACGFRDLFRDEPVMREAGEIVRASFSSMTSPGVLRLRESPYYRAALKLEEFLAGMGELFPY